MAFLFLLSANSFAQRYDLDSLKQVLKVSAEDTNKVKTLIIISDEYRSTNNALCLEYIEKALTLSQKLNFERCILKSLLRKASALSKAGDNEGAIKELNKGEKYFLNGKFPTIRPEFVMRTGYILWKTKKNEEAIKMFLKADTVYSIFKTLKGLEHNAVIGAVESRHVIARIYASQGEYVKAIEFCNKAIDIAETNKQWQSACDAYSVLGGIFTQQQSLDKALDCYKKSLEYAKQANSSRMIAGAYINMGNIYLFKRDNKRAKENYLECLMIQEKAQDDIGVAYAISNLAEIEFVDSNYKKAEEYNIRGLALSETLKDPQLMLGSSLNLSQCEIQLGKLNEAEKHARLAVDLSEQYGLVDFEWKAKNALAKAYAAKGKYKEAFLYKDSVMIIKDTLVNQQQSKLSLELEGKYQNEKKENEIKLQKLDLQVKDSEIASSKKQKMIIIGVLIMVLIFLVVLFNRFKVINKQKEVITKQKTEVEGKNLIIEEKQKEIFDSLQYARQIQKLLLANHYSVNETLPDSFVVFKPKDIVSGDFYWAAKKENRFYLAVCDSTGHGVPGAFMSLLNINFLNEAIMEKNIAEPNDVFNYVRKRLIDNISQDGRQDGMDGILICVKDGSSKITYAAANNAPMIVKDNEVQILGADKMPIGKGEKNDPFQLYTYNATKGDQLYLYTDGFADQFGGPKGKKFKYKPLYELILKNHQLPVLRQEEELYKEFEKWKGSLEQVDDVCILGIRL